MHIVGIDGYPLYVHSARPVFSLKGISYAEMRACDTILSRYYRLFCRKGRSIMDSGDVVGQMLGAATGALTCIGRWGWGWCDRSVPRWVLESPQWLEKRKRKGKGIANGSECCTLRHPSGRVHEGRAGIRGGTGDGMGRMGNPGNVNMRGLQPLAGGRGPVGCSP